MRPLSATARQGAKFEIWLEQLFSDLNYRQIRRNIHYHHTRPHIYRQVDLEYRCSRFFPLFLHLNNHIIVEAKYSSGYNVRLRFRNRQRKTKAGQKIRHIETILEETEERRKFVKARSAILITNFQFEPQLYLEARNFPRISIYDHRYLNSLNNARRGLMDIFRTESSIEQQIASIRLSDYSLEPYHAWVHTKPHCS